ncbi:hypothetical protein V8C35DRAFT_287862 [Trichoderma chlorosporum]
MVFFFFFFCSYPMHGVGGVFVWEICMAGRFLLLLGIKTGGFFHALSWQLYYYTPPYFYVVRFFWALF